MPEDTSPKPASSADAAPRGRFLSVGDVEYMYPMPGQKCRPILGEDMLANVVYFEPHAEAPRHVHVEEQIVMVLEGEFEYEVDGVVRLMRQGDVAMIPPWVPHGAHTGDSPCTELEIFTPPRATVLEHAQAERARAEAEAERPQA
jgi:quercetin dioxygenase-like cupin family protein